MTSKGNQCLCLSVAFLVSVGVLTLFRVALIQPHISSFFDASSQNTLGLVYHLSDPLPTINESSWIPLDSDDYIYSGHLGAAPIVVEGHKLVFFYVPKVSCTVWKQLFRRMMGYSDWKTKFPHNPKTNGLLYLNQLNISYASRILNDPDWVRAIIVRDPKERFLSAYLDKVLRKNSSYVVGACCKRRQTCREQAQTLEGFFELTETCQDPHWRLQSQRMDEKFWPLVNFVGNMEDLSTSHVARDLLERIGAWEDFGAHGWGENGTESIYQSKSTVHHATSDTAASPLFRMEDSLAHWNARLVKYYTPSLEELVERRYTNDYNMPLFALPLRKLDFSSASRNKNLDG